MEERLKKIEQQLEKLFEKIDAIDSWIDDLKEDFLWDFTDPDQNEMPSWFHLIDKIERIEHIVLALNEKLNLKADEVDIDLNKKIVDQEEEINKLKKELEETRKADTINKALAEKGIQEWQKVVDEMAHTINTDVFAALSHLSKMSENPNAKKATHNISRIRDLANLLMWDLNKNRLSPAKKSEQVDIEELIKSQIETIKDGIDSLRLSFREHKKKLLELDIPMKKKGISVIQVNDNIKDGFELVIKDLLRNAFQKTDEENPSIEIELVEDSESVNVSITNNRLISLEEAQWFNENIENGDIQMSKSSKVGLRLVKRWIKNLNIYAEFIRNAELKKTTIHLIIPKVIKYETL